MKIVKKNNKYYKESNWEDKAGWVCLALVFCYIIIEIIMEVVKNV